MFPKVPAANRRQLDVCVTLLTVVICLSTGAESNEMNISEPESCPVEHSPGRRFHVAVFDFANVETPLLIALWVLFVSLAKVAFHSQKTLSKLFPESCLLIVIGVGLGVILYFADDHSDRHQLNTHLFFLVILPPIIMDAGYFMPSRSFFDQFGTIILYAVLNTLINTLWIGFTLWGIGLTGVYGEDVCFPLLHALVFAALLAAVDPVAVLAVFESVHVNEMLYIIVFGEALLNDGVAVVLYHVFETFSLIGQEYILVVDVIAGIGSFFVIVTAAPGIGILMGLFGGFCSRFTHHVRIMEPMIVVVICYMSFLLGEMFHLSGILACTFCGITMRKYVEANISKKSQTTVKYVFKMLASVAEAIIFMYLGIAAVSDSRVWNTSFILLTLLFCLVYRALGVWILAVMSNRVRLAKLTYIDQFIMSYGGLRGAIAFALSVLLEKEEFTSRDLLITATIVEIYFTNLIMGSTVEPIVKWLKVKRNENEDPSINEKIALRLIDHLMVAVEGVAHQRGHHLVREKFSHFNNHYLKPFIVGRNPRQKQLQHHHKAPKGRGFELFRVYERLSQKDARQLARNPQSATSLSRWNSAILRSNSQTPLAEVHIPRFDSVYELPSYWRSSTQSMYDDSANGSRRLPERAANGSAPRQGCTQCSCNCHAPGAADVIASTFTLSPSGDVADTKFDTSVQSGGAKPNQASKRIGLDGLHGTKAVDKTGRTHSNQFVDQTAITFSAKAAAADTVEKPAPVSVNRKGSADRTANDQSIFYENKAFGSPTAADARDDDDDDDTERDPKWHF